MAETLNVSTFYDRLAADYDNMTGFEKRFVHEKPFFRLLVEKYAIKTALDAGSGTGFHSLLLSQLGVNVTAIDLSQEMLDALGRHATTMHLQVKRVAAGFQTLRDRVEDQFDAVFCLGNSLPHMLTEADLLSALTNFASVLKPGGILFLQLLNYDRVLALRERVQSVKESNGATFVRFYDYDHDGGLVLFNLLKLERKDNSVQQTLLSVPLRPITCAELLPALDKTGYTDVHTFGGISMDAFDRGSSKDLAVIATRKA